MLKDFPKFIGVFLVIFAGLSQICCDVKTPIIDNQISNYKSLSQKDSVKNETCEKWQGHYNRLSDGAKISLNKEGIALNVIEEGYILSPELVEDCGSRIKIGEYIYNRMGGHQKAKDEEFAEESSKEIVRVLRQTWNTYSDGATHEKYLLLIDEGIKDEDIAPFVGELIKTEGFNPMLKPEPSEPELYYVLYNRPLPSLKPIILESLKEAEKNKNFIGQIQALLILHRDTNDKNYILKLKGIGKNSKLSDKAKILLNNIIKEIEAGRKLNYEKEENLEFEISQTQYDL